MENIYNYTKFTNVSRVKYAVYPLYLTGNIADSTAVHRKPRKKYRPGEAIPVQSFTRRKADTCYKESFQWGTKILSS